MLDVKLFGTVDYDIGRIYTRRRLRPPDALNV